MLNGSANTKELNMERGVLDENGPRRTGENFTHEILLSLILLARFISAKMSSCQKLK